MTEEGHGKAAVLTADDENSVRSLLARLYDAWARGDGDGYAACFAEKSDYITFNGMHLRSRAEKRGAAWRTLPERPQGHQTVG